MHYIPVYLQPYYQNLGFNKGLCPVDEEFYKTELSIPMYPTLTDEDLELLAKTKHVIKVSRRDFPAVIALNQIGATTVASTMRQVNYSS